MSAAIREIHAESFCVHEIHTGLRGASHFDLEKGTGRAKACCGGRLECKVLSHPDKFMMLPLDHEWLIPDGVQL